MLHPLTHSVNKCNKGDLNIEWYTSVDDFKKKYQICMLANLTRERASQMKEAMPTMLSYELLHQWKRSITKLVQNK